MFNKFLTLFLAISLSQIVFCQQGWVQQPSGVTTWLSSVLFTDINTGYVIGYAGGTIIKTTNAGVNWINMSIGGSGFNSGYFIQNTGYVVGNNGIIYKTINAGLSWVSQTSGTPYNLYSVFFSDVNTGYITGHDLDPPNSVMRKTTNGGTTWFPVSIPPSSYGLRSLYFFNSNTGFAGGRFGVIIKTNNGGTSWSSQYLLPNQTMITSIYFANINTGYLVGGEPFTGGLIFKTTNGGANWFSQLTGITNNYLYSVFVPPQIGSDTVYTVGNNGNNGIILKTANGGTAWNYQISGTVNALNSVYFINNYIGYAVGANGIILKTTNGGVTGLVPLSNEIPNEYKLFQNYPNPFNPKTIINFQLSMFNYVSLKVYDVLGHEVAVLVNEALKPGTYEAEFSGENYPSGVYYYRLQTPEYNETLKMILIK